MNSLEQVGTTRREYRLTTGRKLNQTVLAAAFLVGAGFFSSSPWTRSAANSPWPSACSPSSSDS